jgi:hypothetical protein
MKFVSKVLTVTLVSFLFSSVVNATMIGNLTYDGTYITGGGYTYLGLDTTSVIGTTYADFVAATSAGGAFEGFSIAGVAAADRFIDSFLGGPNACSTAGTTDGTTCGTASGWSSGLFGLNYTGTSGDWFQFEDYNGTSYDVGATGIRLNGDVQQYENAGWAQCNLCDEGIGYLVYQATVPEPSTLALLSIGFLGIGAMRKLKKH